MKKDTLYTVNKWNMPAFMPQGNMYWDGSELPSSLPERNIMVKVPNNPDIIKQKLYSTSWTDLGKSTYTPTITANKNILNQTVNAPMAGIDNALGYFAPPTNLELPNTIENPIPQPKIKRNINTEAVKDVATTVASPVFGAINKGISGDYASNNGAAISNFSNTLGGALMTVNPLIGTSVMLAGNIVGGLVNNAEGKQQEEARKRAEEKREQQERFQLAMADINNAVNYNNDINNNTMAMSYKDGGGLSRDKDYKSSKKPYPNVDKSDFAGGGRSYPIPTKADAIDALRLAGLHHRTDVIDKIKAKYPSLEKALGGPLVTGNPVQFALGGDVQTHGGDYSTGLVRVDAGGSHSENPYGGVQFGTDSRGTPNLLEEGEVVWNDYVFSVRILADEATKKKFHLPLKKDISYADIAKKLEREASERPSDPISKAGLEAQMADLAEQQERQKQEMEAESARRAFEALTPEEQTAVMQRVAEEEAMAQQAAAQQEQMAHAQMTQPMEQYPEGMMQQQPVPEETMMQQAPAMGAMGGKVNRFDYGGKLLNALGFHTKKEYEAWLKNNGIKFSDSEETIDVSDHDKWLDAIATKNPALAHAMRQGYDFGRYTPDNTAAYTINFDDAGNWNARNGAAWSKSKDAMYQEAVEKGLIKDGMSEKDLEAVLKSTDTYKKATDTLRNDAEARRRYFAGILKSSAPEEAKRYARKYINEDGTWKEGIDNSYENTMAAVRDKQPGSYWKTPQELARDSQKVNYVINDDGTVEEIIGDVPSDWTSAGNYAWASPNSDFAYNYYRRPMEQGTADTSEDDSDTGVEDTGKDKGVKPVYRDERLRYAGLMGPLTALGLQAANFGRPDFTEMDNIMNRARSQVALAKWRPIGDYLTYRPFDELSQRNRNAANLAAGLRQIGNTVNPNKQAATVAALYNGLNADGQLGIAAQAANSNQRAQVAGFNKDTNTYNANAFTQNSQFNTGILNQHNQYINNLASNIAARKMAEDKDWYGSMYANTGNVFKDLAALGKENAEWNMISDMWADGIPGVATPKTNSAKGHLTSTGGKIKRKKKGLTY